MCSTTELNRQKQTADYYCRSVARLSYIVTHPLEEYVYYTRYVYIYNIYFEVYIKCIYLACGSHAR